VGLGLLLGVAAWVAVLGALLVVGVLVYALGGEDALPKAPPALVPWIAALPVGVRLLVSLSAGVVEEAFFRGFLQPRAGVLLSTAFFALAHASYGQPLMLIGVTLLSLVYAFLVRWRQNVVVAATAHAFFDGLQLLVIIPAALELLGRQATAALLAALL
ncbi:MAG: lysostaphin resistance A-like protein, partial [Thermoanaerobaculia bacterium]